MGQEKEKKMKNKTKQTVKQTVAKAAGKSFTTIADVFATLPCFGPWYEPKMPEKLKK